MSRRDGVIVPGYDQCCPLRDALADISQQPLVRSKPLLQRSYADPPTRFPPHSPESGCSNSTWSLTLSAEIVTNNPTRKPMPDSPVNGLPCWCANTAASAQMAAKAAQIAVLNLTIVVRVLFALSVAVSVISCSIRISPFTF
jgi:hypothetical protein